MYRKIFRLSSGNVLQKYVCHLTIILLKLDDIQVLLEMKENVFYVTWMYWRTNSILFCNVQSIMICVKNISRNIIDLDHLLLNWFSYCQWKTGKKFIHLACKARNNLVWLTCVIYNFLTYLCYFLISHIYMLYNHVIITCHIVYWWTVMFKVNKEFEFE